MASLNVPEDHKTPMKGAYKPCAKSGQLLFTTRGKEGDPFNDAISAIGVNAKEGMKYMADAMVLKNSNIQPTVVFNFYRTANESLYSKDVLANSLDDLMGEIVRQAYTSDISGVFCFTAAEEEDLNDKVKVLQYTVHSSEGTTTYKYLRPDFDVISVKSLLGLVSATKIKVEVEIIRVSVVRNMARTRTYF